MTTDTHSSSQVPPAGVADVYHIFLTLENKYHFLSSLMQSNVMNCLFRVLNTNEDIEHRYKSLQTPLKIGGFFNHGVEILFYLVRIYYHVTDLDNSFQTQRLTHTSRAFSIPGRVRAEEQQQSSSSSPQVSPSWNSPAGVAVLLTGVGVRSTGQLVT